jgi:hypothetical protein
MVSRNLRQFSSVAVIFLLFQWLYIVPAKYVVLNLIFPDFAPFFVLNGQILSTISYSDDSVA